MTGQLDDLFEHRAQRIDRLSNPLRELDTNIDWEAYCTLLERVRIKIRKSSADRKSLNATQMFLTLVLASIYSLSDEQLEYQIEGRHSFERFIGLLNTKHAPDRNSFWLFREALKEFKLTESLFYQFNRNGLIARKGQWIDTNWEEKPIQRNTSSENVSEATDANLKAQRYRSHIPYPDQRRLRQAADCVGKARQLETRLIPLCRVGHVFVRWSNGAVRPYTVLAPPLSKCASD